MFFSIKVPSKGHQMSIIIKEALHYAHDYLPSLLSNEPFQDPVEILYLKRSSRFFAIKLSSWRDAERPQTHQCRHEFWMRCVCLPLSARPPPLLCPARSSRAVVKTVEATATVTTAAAATGSSASGARSDSLRTPWFHHSPRVSDRAKLRRRTKCLVDGWEK